MALQPGDDFQPAYLDSPSQPTTDFLWSYVESVLVSKRVKDALLKAKVEGVVFCPIIPRKIGNRSQNLPPLIPESGEPMDMIDEIKNVIPAENVAGYYEMVVVSESGYPPGGQPQKICVACERETNDKYARKLVMHQDLWKRDGIFFLATTLWIIVADRIKQILQELDATNVEYELM